MLRIAALILVTVIATAVQAAESKIGVLYIERTFEGSTMVQAVQTDLKAKAEQVGAQVDEINGKLEELKAELESTPENSPAHLQAKEQFEILRLRRKLFLERSQEALLGLEVERLKACYLKIREVLDRFAEQEGYHLVLMAPRREVGAKRVQDLNLELATHTVVYHQDAMDITEAFTAYLNDTVTSLEAGDGKPAAAGAGQDAATAPVIDLGADGE